MEVATRKIQIDSRSDTVKLTFIGDVHLGGRDCDVKLLRRCIKKIKDDKDHYWFGMGDYAEFINMTDKRFDPAELEEGTRADVLNKLMARQADRVVAELEPIKDTCLGLLEGNHEKKLELRSGVDPYENICRDLRHKVEWDLRLGYCAIVKIRIERKGSTGTQKIKVCMHHGRGGGRRTGGSVNSTEDMARIFPFCNIYVRGHDHRRYAIVESVVDVADSKDKLIDLHRAYGDSGTFKKTFQQGSTGYGEMAMFPPTSLGVISFSLNLNSMTEQFDIAPHCSTSGLPA